MPEISKPSTLNQVWADAGDKIKPEDSKIAIGWLAEIPTRQNFNWLDNRQDQFIAHLNQHGLPVWDSSTEYQAGKSYVQGSDGLIYMAITTNTNQDPVSDTDNNYWNQAFVTLNGYQGGKRFVGYEVFSSSFTAITGHRYYASSPLTMTLPAGNLGDAVVLAKKAEVQVTVVDQDSNTYTPTTSETTFVYTNDGIVLLEGGGSGSDSSSIDGPVTVSQGSTNTYTITDYNAFSIYSVATSVGTVSRTGDTISLVVPNPANATQITLSVTRDGTTETYLIAVDAQSVVTPSIVYPSQGQTAVETAPTLTSTAFSTVPVGQDTHQSSQWQIATDAGFSNIVFDSGVSTTNKTNVSVPAGVLSTNTVYYTRVRHTGAIIGNSAWSATRTFTTTNQSVVTPTVNISGGPTSVGETPTITTSSFAVSTGTDTHVSTDWQVVRTSDNVVVWQSLGNTTNKTSIVVPASILQVNTEYKARARHSGANAGNSAWGQYTFTTLASFFVFNPSSAGLAYGGGYYAGANIIVDGVEYALIVAPKTMGGENTSVTNNVTSGTPVSPNTRNDGVTNTSVLVSGSSSAAVWASSLTIGGYSDWYLPAIDEMEIVYRYLKPTTDATRVTQNSPYNEPNGVNNNSNPVGNQYTTGNPSQTSSLAFRSSGAESLTANYYWTSTRDTHYAGNNFYAMIPSGSNSGNMQGDLNTLTPLYARAVRRVPIPT